MPDSKDDRIKKLEKENKALIEQVKRFDEARTSVFTIPKSWIEESERDTLLEEILECAEQDEGMGEKVKRFRELEKEIEHLE